MRKLILALAITMVACTKLVETKITNTVTNEKYGSSEVKWNYPVASSSNAAVADSINKAITDSLATFTDSPNLDAVIKEAEQYNRDSINFIDMLDWHGFQSPKIVSIYMLKYFYRGGAHGNTVQYALNFDAQNGKTIEVESQISNKEEFLKLFIDEYCKKYEINRDSSLLKIGYFYELDQLQIPDILLLTDTGIEGFYSDYQIACHAVGMTSAVVPYDKIKDILKLDVADIKPIEIAK